MHIVNTLEEARVALKALSEGLPHPCSPPAGELEEHSSSLQPLHLASPPYAACSAGVNYYRALLTQLRSEFPEVPFTFTLCCGDDAAIAHDALRLGFTHIRCECSDGVQAELQAIANEMGAVVTP